MTKNGKASGTKKRPGKKLTIDSLKEIRGGMMAEPGDPGDDAKRKREEVVDCEGRQTRTWETE